MSFFYVDPETYKKYRDQVIGHEAARGQPQEGHHHHVEGIGTDADRHDHHHHHDGHHHANDGHDHRHAGRSMVAGDASATSR